MDLFPLILLSLLIAAEGYGKRSINVTVIVPGLNNIVVNGLLYEYMNDEDDSRNCFGEIPPQWSYQFVKPALDVAMDTIHNTPGLLDDYVIRLNYYEAGDECDRPSPEESQLSMVTALLKDDMTAIIGPVAGYSVARVVTFSSHWNVLHLTPGGISYGLRTKGNQTINLNMARTGEVATQVGFCVSAIFKFFHWNTTAVQIFEDDTFERYHYFLAEGIFNSTVRDLIMHQVRLSEYQYGNGSYGYDVILESIYYYGRIIVLIADDDIIIKMLSHMNKERSKEFVYIIIDLDDTLGPRPWRHNEMEKEKEEHLRKIFENALIITAPTFSKTARYSNFEKKFQDNSLLEDNKYPAFFHDTLLLLAQVLNSTLYQDSPMKRDTPIGYSPNRNRSRNRSLGTEMMKNYVRGKSFEGVTGDISFNHDGDRMFRYSILDLNTNLDHFEEVGRYDFETQTFSYLPGKSASWPSGAVPRDVPVCGFKNEHCTLKISNEIYSFILATVFVFGAIVIFAYTRFRKYMLMKELEDQLWRIYWKEIRIVDENATEKIELMENDVIDGNFTAADPLMTKDKRNSNSYLSRKVGFSLGLCKNRLVALKVANQHKVDLNNNLLMELKYMRDLSHEHLTRFEGACIDHIRTCILTEYCPKGSLRDILLNKDLSLDWMFKYSLMNDLIKGMIFLHNSPISWHGNLKSTNCVIDSRFVLKITDFGLHSLRVQPQCDGTEKYYEKMLWMAPEGLRGTSISGGQHAMDVYSFGIIAHEIALRKGTFYVGGIRPMKQVIVNKVRDGRYPCFRPLLDHSVLSEELCEMLEECWSETVADRPNFNQLKQTMKKFNKENMGNLVENLLQRMEQYASNLEGLVEERTAAYLEEKKKADDLLYQMLPVSVVERLKRGESVQPEAFENVTIFFSDIVGFTQLSASSSPMEVVDMLNDLYSLFDSVIEGYDVYKVETIGDAYMLVSGLPVRNGSRHAVEIARSSLALLRAVHSFKMRHRPDEKLQLRIGIHSGSCCAGVVGLKMPRYCLFGDTVNTASRLESTGIPLRIHVSQTTKDLLDLFNAFHLQYRGEVEMKGKGKLKTYFLLGENPLGTS